MAIAHDLFRSIWHEADVKTMVRVFVILRNVSCGIADNFTTYR
jgi:hypothetical protein